MLPELINAKVELAKLDHAEREAQTKFEIEEAWKEAIEDSSYIDDSYTDAELIGQLNLKRENCTIPFKTAMKFAEDEGFVVKVKDYIDQTNVEVVCFCIKENQILIR